MKRPPHRFALDVLALAACLWPCSSLVGGCGSAAERRGVLPHSSGEGPSGDGGFDDANYVDPGADPDKPCSEQTFAPQQAADPDILLLMDASGSMADGTPSKWQQTSTAIHDVIVRLENQRSPIEWGLVLFPSDNECGVDDRLPVTVGINRAAAIAATIAAVGPRGNTPMASAVQVGLSYYDTLDDQRAHYFLIATDGEPNCDSSGLRTCQADAQCPPGQVCQRLPLGGGICTDPTGGAAVKAIAAARQKGVKTFVVGISLDDTSATLNLMATEGGTARPGREQYYPVTDQATLEAALDNIASQVVACSFRLQSLPMANQEIVVKVGGVEVPRDRAHENGWDVDGKSMTLTFYGNVCAAFRMKPCVVSVGYTCPPPG